MGKAFRPFSVKVEQSGTTAKYRKPAAVIRFHRPDLFDKQVVPCLARPLSIGFDAAFADILVGRNRIQLGRSALWRSSLPDDGSRFGYQGFTLEDDAA